MSKIDTATRAAAIAAAADKFDGDLPHLDSSEYMRGICEVLADTFGVDDTEDPDYAKYSIWAEIEAVQIAAEREARARKIAHDTMEIHLDHRDINGWSLAQRRTLVTALQAAALAGMTKENHSPAEQETI